MYYNKESGENGEGERGPLTQRVIGCAIEVHRYLGPGLLDSSYSRPISGAHFLPLSALATLFVNFSLAPLCKIVLREREEGSPL
jgi:hypothetical protein